jgi:hypothetical protein
MMGIFLNYYFNAMEWLISLVLTGSSFFSLDLPTLLAPIFSDFLLIFGDGFMPTVGTCFILMFVDIFAGLFSIGFTS